MANAQGLGGAIATIQDIFKAIVELNSSVTITGHSQSDFFQISFLIIQPRP